MSFKERDLDSLDDRGFVVVCAVSTCNVRPERTPFVDATWRVDGDRGAETSSSGFG